ncbi:MAG TPA: acyl carrier protein [Thermoleophilaceae bacterium]|nr:acyl carrier protein [Thermoleophilaceae bacterium]
MSKVSTEEIRSFVLQELDEPLRALGHEPGELPDEFDLHESGVIDSFGILELITALEDRFSLEIDYENLDPEELTKVGPFARYVSQQTAGPA